MDRLQMDRLQNETSFVSARNRAYLVAYRNVSVCYAVDTFLVMLLQGRVNQTNVARLCFTRPYI